MLQQSKMFVVLVGLGLAGSAGAAPRTESAVGPSVFSAVRTEKAVGPDAEHASQGRAPQAPKQAGGTAPLDLNAGF
ncbi:MAG: hypothetical protein ACXU86_09400 [Archangium sp.]